MRYILIFLILILLLNPLNCQIQVINVYPNNLKCYNINNGAIQLNVLGGGNSPYLFEWENGSQLSNRDSLPNGKYICSITDHSIPPIIQIDTFEITSPPKPEPIYHLYNWNCKLEKPIIKVDAIDNFVLPYYKVNSISNDKKDTIWNKIDENNFINLASFSKDQINANDNLILKDSNGCLLNTNFIVSDSLEKFIDIDYTSTPMKDTFIYIGSQINLKIDINNYINPNSLIINWKDGTLQDICDSCNTISVSPTSKSFFNYEIFNNDTGCKKNGRILVNVFNSNDNKVYIPNIFSPDFNGYNDYFIPKFNETLLKIKKMIVFNRWGGILFEKSDFYPTSEIDGWDGRVNDKLLDEGVYLYYIEAEFKDKTIEKYKGDVYLQH